MSIPLHLTLMRTIQCLMCLTSMLPAWYCLYPRVDNRNFEHNRGMSVVSALK